METPLFFRNGNYKLFGVLSEPETDDSPLWSSSIGVAVCHPFAEEKLIAHRTLVNLGRRLTKEGVHCLRFDYMGHGDSEGDFEDSTVESGLSDIRSAVEVIRQRAKVRRVGLVGFRFGGTLASLACSGMSGIDFLIIVAPVINGTTYIEQCFRSNLTTQMRTYKKIVKNRTALFHDLLEGRTVNYEGYELTRDLVEQIQSIDLPTRPPSGVAEVLLIDIAKKTDDFPGGEIKALAANWRAGVTEVEAMGLSAERFWLEHRPIDTPNGFRALELENCVIGWLKSRYL